MNKLLIAALLGGAVAVGPAFAQSGGTGGISGGSPGSPGDGSAGTSSPNMGGAANRAVDPGMREGAPMTAPRSMAAAPTPRARPAEQRMDTMRTSDLDKDGTLSLAEAKSAAAKHYDKMDPDRDDSMTLQESRRHKGMGAAFRDADADGDGKVTKAEWLAMVERRFQAADTDHGGVLDRAELRTKPGKVVARLMS